MYARQVLVCIAALVALSACGSSTREPVTQLSRSSGAAATTPEATPLMDPSTIQVRIKLVGGLADGEVLWVPLSRIRDAHHTQRNWGALHHDDGRGGVGPRRCPGVSTGCLCDPRQLRLVESR
jgi:hypothetical protein